MLADPYAPNWEHWGHDDAWTGACESDESVEDSREDVWAAAFAGEDESFEEIPGIPDWLTSSLTYQRSDQSHML